MQTFVKFIILLALGMAVGAASAQQPLFFGMNVNGSGPPGPQLVAGTYGGGFCGSSPTCSWTTTCAVGHTAVIVGFPYNVTGTTLIFSTTSTNTLSVIYGANVGSTNPTTTQGTGLAIITSCNGSSGTYTATQSGSGNMGLSYFEVSNSVGLDAANVCAGNNVTPTPGFLPSCSLTTTTSSDFIYWIGLTASGAMSFVPTGYTSITLGGFLVADAYQKSNTTGTNTASAVNSGGSGTMNTQALMVALK